MVALPKVPLSSTARSGRRPPVALQITQILKSLDDMIFSGHEVKIAL